MAEQLCKLFKDKVSEIIPNVDKQKLMKDTLKSIEMDAKNITDLQFFDRVKNSVEIPIHNIIVGQNEEKKLNSFEYFYFEANEWKSADIEKLLNVETCILLFKFGRTFNHFATFTSDSTYDVRIKLFLSSHYATMVQIGIDFLMKDLKSPKLRYMCENLNENSENFYEKNLFQVLNESGRTDAIELILHNECCFPDISAENQVPLVKERIKFNKQFHQFLKEDNKDNRKAIDEFLKANSNLRYINNEHNESASAVAIKEQKFELYSYLYARKLTVRINESRLLQDKDFLSFFRYRQLPYEKYTDKLLQTLTSATSTVNKSNPNLNIDDIYKKLILIPNFDLILNILRRIKPLFIIVDYEEKNISQICPYVSGAIRGLYDSQLNRIFISGGGGTEQMLGTFAHEFTHFAMDLLYNNNAVPYLSDDDERKNDYTEIVKDIQQKVTDEQIKEEIITLVFKYEKNYLHSELIVRINHILAYYGYEKGTQILEKEAPDLLSFYNDKIVPDFNKFLRTHVNRNDHLYNPLFIQAIENNCNLYNIIPKKILTSVIQTSGNVVIKTNCVELTCMKLFSNMTAKESAAFNLNNTYMIDLKTLSNNIKLALAHFQHYELLIVADEALQSQSDVNAWTNIKEYVNKSGKRFIFVIEKEQTLPFQTSNFIDIFKWTDFDEISQNLIFNKLEVNFQNNKLKISELMDYKANTDILNKILSVDLIRNCIFCKSLLQVGKKLLSNSKNYIEREMTTTIFELDELADGSIFNESEANTLNEIINNKHIIKFPGKKIQIDSESTAISLEFDVASYSRKMFDPIKDDVFIFSSQKRTRSSIFVDYDNEIFVNDFSYADLLTFYQYNKKSFNNLHWFMESDEQDYLFYHLKTFGTLDTIRYKYQSKVYKVNESDFFKKLGHQKITLIAATAGMGKTETIKSLAQKLVKDNPSTWAPVVILSRNAELLKKFNAKKFTVDNIFDFLAEFLECDSSLEKEIFKYCCNKKNGNVYLFLDGADEISPRYTDKVCKIIEILSKTNIKRITVTVRLNIKTDFETRLSTIAIELIPLTHDDQIKFMSNIWKNKQIEPIDNLEKISRRVIKQFRIFDIFLDNPLQIEIVADNLEDKLNDFSKKLETIPSFFANETTLMEIYEKFIDKEVEIAIEEHLQLKDDLSDRKKQAEKYLKDTERLLKYAAIITLLDEQKIKFFLSPRDIKNNKEFLSKVNNFGRYERIVDGIISGKLNFVHRTYAEYFFADFLINDWKNWRTKEGEYYFFDNILVKQQFASLRKFLNSSSGTSDFLSRSPEYYEVPKKLHGAVFQNVEENNLKILLCLDKLKFNMTIKPSTMTSDSDHIDFASLASQNVDTITYLVTECKKVHLSIYELARLKLKTLYNTLPFKCIELIKALVQCELFDLEKYFEIDKTTPSEERRKTQERRNLFESDWNKVKEEATTEDPYAYDNLFKSFTTILP